MVKQSYKNSALLGLRPAWIPLKLLSLKIKGNRLLDPILLLELEEWILLSAIPLYTLANIASFLNTLEDEFPQIRTAGVLLQIRDEIRLEWWSKSRHPVSRPPKPLELSQLHSYLRGLSRDTFRRLCLSPYGLGWVWVWKALGRTNQSPPLPEKWSTSPVGTRFSETFLGLSRKETR